MSTTNDDQALDETWSVDEPGDYIHAFEGRLMIGWLGTPARRRLAAAAPDMARALLQLLNEQKHRGCAHENCVTARASLVKAGVRLP